MTGKDMTIFEQLHPTDDFRSWEEVDLLESSSGRTGKRWFDKRNSAGRTGCF
jgi:hypothetical protein